MVFIVGKNLPHEAETDLTGIFDPVDNGSVFMKRGSTPGTVIKGTNKMAKFECEGVIESLPVDNENGKDVKAGDELVIRRDEVVNVITDTDIPEGAFVGSDANGKAIQLATPTDFDEWSQILGIVRIPKMGNVIGVELTL